MITYCRFPFLKTSRFTRAAACAAFLFLPLAAFAQDTPTPEKTTEAADATPAPGHGHQNPEVPPELTKVSGRLAVSEDEGIGGGIAYFIFQHRLMEIPHEKSMERVRAIAENAVALDQDGSFTLDMAPGNYTLIYDPSDTDGQLEPGPESMAKMKRASREQVEQRIAAIKENAQKGLAVKNGVLGEAYVLENRIVRPPSVDFGTMILGKEHVVTVKAVTQEDKPIDFPALLRLRGKNGDIYEAHSPSAAAPGVFTYHDVYPQSYEVIATAVKPRPGAGDEATTPALKNAQLLFEGEPLEHTVTVTPRTREEAMADDAPPVEAPVPATQQKAIPEEE